MDSTDFNKVMLAVKGDRLFQRSYKIDPQRSHEALTVLGEFLKVAKIQPASIQRIIVNKGPGSFTGTRVGVAHAQALGFALNIPVEFLAKESFYKNFIRPSI